MKYPRTVLYIGIDSFYSQAARISNNIPHDKSVVVVQERSRAAGIVVCVSGEAISSGIEIGMGIRRAKRKCPDAVFCTADYAVYRDYFESILVILSKYSPLLEPHVHGYAYMDVTGSEKLFGDAKTISELIIVEIYKKLGFVVRTGSGSNRLIAFSAFYLGDRTNIIDHANEKEVIKDFPIELILYAYPRLFKVDEYMQRFQKLGINKFGQLASIPDQLLSRQFGKTGFLLKRLANGIDEAGVRAEYPKETIIIEHTCEYEILEPNELEPIIDLLSSRASRELRENNYLAGEVILKIFWNNESIPGYLKFKTPTDSRESILYALTKLFRERIKPGMPVYKLEIKLISLEKILPKQISLFGNSEKDLKIKQTVNTIQTRFGDKSISTASLIG